MAMKEYVGSIVMEIDGREVEVTSVSVSAETGRKLVKTMNKTGRAKGIARGIATWELDVSAVVPLEDDIDWEAIEGARLTLYPPPDSGGRRISYLDCFTMTVGDKYQVDGEATIDIKMGALRKVTE